MAKIEVELANGQKAGKTLQELSKEANKLNKEIAKLPVGSKEFVDKAGQLQQVNGQLKNVRDQVKGTAEASDELNDKFNNIIPFADKFKSIGESFGGMKKGVGGLVSSMGTLRGAIISTGLGALVVILGSLIAYFTETQEGMDKLTAITRPAAAVFEKLKMVLAELGEKIFKRIGEAIENPKQALLDLGNIIKDNIIKRFEALALFGPALKKIFSGDIAEGFKDLGNASIQLTTGIEKGIDKIQAAASELADFVAEAVEQGSRLDELQKAIERAEIRQITRSKQLDLIIKQQKYIVEDATASWDKRRAAAEKALGAQETLLRSELSLIDMKLAKMREEQKLHSVTREDEKAMAELQAQRLEKEAQITEQRIEFRNKIVEFDKAQAAELLAIEQNLSQLRLDAMKEGIDKEIAMIEAETKSKIEALQGSEAQIREATLLLEEVKRQQIQELRDKQAQEDYDKKIADHELELTTQLNQINEDFLQEEITRAEWLAKLEQQGLDFQARKLALIRQANGENSTEYQKEYATYLQMQQAASDRAVAIKQQEIKDQQAAMEGSLGTFGNFFGALAGMQKEGTAQWKAFATTQAIISTVQSAINAYQSTAAIPIVGPALAPIAAGLATVAGMQNVRKIQQTKVEAPTKKAALGMVLRGPSHAQGGIPIEAEGDEIILTKGVYRDPSLRAMASEINVAAGGRKFAAGGPVNPFSSGSPGGSSGRNADAFGLGEMSSLLRENLAAVNSRIDNIRVYNVATDTADVLDDVNRIKNEADV
jgi:hypothetical protein